MRQRDRRNWGYNAGGYFEPSWKKWLRYGGYIAALVIFLYLFFRLGIAMSIATYGV